MEHGVQPHRLDISVHKLFQNWELEVTLCMENAVQDKKYEY